jgi:deazaflavin-dependent oxidoreductase (nitroreductase family)
MSQTSQTTETAAGRPVTVPRWLVRTIWLVHRAAYTITRGRFGLRPSTQTQWGMLRLSTVGRRTGKARVAIVGYIVDGPNLVVPAMNGWADPEPAWWLNLQADPNATVELPHGRRDVTAHASVGEERARLWKRFLDLNSSAFNDASAALRSRETAIVVLEPRP